MAKMSVLLDVCSACGSRCKYCIHQSKRLCKRENMSQESFDAITEVLLREGFRDVYLYFTGEPLLNPLYPEFLSSCGVRGFASVNTATKLNAKVDWDDMDCALGFCDNSHVFFLVGVDSLEDESLKAISPGASAELLNANLEGLSRTVAKHRRVKVLVNTVVTRPNEKQLADIERRCLSLGFDWSRREMGFFMSRRAEPSDVEAVAALVPSCGSSRFKIENGVVFSGRSGRCTDLLEPGISPTGDVVVCCHDMLYEGVVGNILKTKSLIGILNSKEYQDTLSQCRKMEAVFCKGCS